jgi:hypothetical protein
MNQVGAMTANLAQGCAYDVLVTSDSPGRSLSCGRYPTWALLAVAPRTPRWPDLPGWLKSTDLLVPERDAADADLHRQEDDVRRHLALGRARLADLDASSQASKLDPGDGACASSTF